MTRQLLAIRHAATDTQGVCFGQSDVASIASAADTAAPIEGLLGELAFTAVWSSPLVRCHGPAALVAQRRAWPLHVDARLLELSYGRWEGRAWDVIEREEPEQMRVWMQDWQTTRPPGGESARDLEARVRSWLTALEPGAHLLVGHAGVMRALHVIVRGTSWSDAMALAVPHLGAARFELP